ncbi:MAG: peptidoglycan DD-metalloendopeptidase family protein [Chloroflexi bacterium]|nr:peptidoglycan DD-metalloendopeptidase family protein [Chloroflexota bacterium]
MEHKDDERTTDTDPTPALASARTLLWLVPDRDSAWRYFGHLLLLLLVATSLKLAGWNTAPVQGVSAVYEDERTIVRQPSVRGQPVSVPFLDYLTRAPVPHTTIPRRYRIEVITYTVQPGDNASTIAEKFGISVDTILWNNGKLQNNPDYLTVGQDLYILPVSGVWHTVQQGDTLESIAKQYKVSVEAITGYEGNFMTPPYEITVGQKLIVPGGEKPYTPQVVVAWHGTVPAAAKRGTGTFGTPVSGVITQGYFPAHRAIDIGAPEGTPVYAADSGYVAMAQWVDQPRYGRMVLIDHGNGFQTLYAHLKVYYVEAGQSVAKGQKIGLVGTTGYVTGPHLHFAIIKDGVPRNPRIYLP